MGAVKRAGDKIGKAVKDPVYAATLGQAEMSDLDPTYRKGLVGGKLLGGEASLEAEAAAKEGADLQAKAQMEALDAIKAAGAQATETLSPLTQQAMPAESSKRHYLV